MNSLQTDLIRHHSFALMVGLMSIDVSGAAAESAGAIANKELIAQYFEQGESGMDLYVREISQKGTGGIIKE